MSVCALCYIGIEVSDVQRWEAFLLEQLGLLAGAPTDAGERTYRIDDQAQRICVFPGVADDVAYLGFQVANSAALEAVADRLEQAGFSVERGDDALRAERRVVELIRTHDPQGLEVEICYGPYLQPERPFRSAVCAGFVTAEQGLGHVVLCVSDMGAARHFYLDLLGFRISDFVVLGPPDSAVELVFLHCNPRHHTIALAPVPSQKRLLHFMLQLCELDDVGLALDRCRAAAVPVSVGLGRHTNDHMVSFYVQSPSGFEVEIGSGARTVEESSWRVERHAAASIWGHRRDGHLLDAPADGLRSKRSGGSERIQERPRK